VVPGRRALRAHVPGATLPGPLRVAVAHGAGRRALPTRVGAPAGHAPVARRRLPHNGIPPRAHLPEVERAS
jgi:hypothetical protein